MAGLQAFSPRFGVLAAFGRLQEVLERHVHERESRFGQQLVGVHATLGAEWLTPTLYRLGASSLLNDILMQLRKEQTGSYQGPDYFTVD